MLDGFVNIFRAAGHVTNRGLGCKAKPRMGQVSATKLVVMLDGANVSRYDFSRNDRGPWRDARCNG